VYLSIFSLLSVYIQHRPAIVLLLVNYAVNVIIITAVVVIIKVDRVVWTDSEAEASSCGCGLVR